MRRDDPVAEQEGPFRQQGPDQAILPSNQDAEPDHDDDRQVNRVHMATPLSPMAPRNSTPGAAADLSRLPVEADHVDKALEGLRVAPFDIDATPSQGGGLRIEDPTHRHEIGARNHDVGLARLAQEAGAPASQRDHGLLERLTRLRQL